MSANDLRKSLMIIESAGTDAAKLDEAPMGILKTLGTAARSLWSDVAIGELKAGDAANKQYASYLRYLGSVGKRADTGTLGDLYTFLSAELITQGVDRAKMEALIQKAITGGISNADVTIASKNDIAKYKDSAISDDAKNRLSKTFLLLTQMRAKLEPKEPEQDDEAGAQGAAPAAGNAAAPAAGNAAAPAAGGAAAPAAGKAAAPAAGKAAAPAAGKAAAPAAGKAAGGAKNAPNTKDIDDALAQLGAA